jgi:hypothetical protein
MPPSKKVGRFLLGLGGGMKKTADLLSEGS